MKLFKTHSFIFTLCLLFSLFFFSPESISATVKTSDLETVPWSMVTESSIINEKGWLQSMCATDQYIVCLVNTSKKGTDPDTLIAFYRNTTDADGNPVEQYSYAFSVTETDYEHGNGMTYNPSTQEIAIAGLFTNDPSDAGAIFIVDANTLQFKRKIQVGNGSINFFGIDYVPEKDQYVLMANRIADYAFYFTDSDLQIVDKLNLHLSYSRSSFQDFCVAGDAIISIPYMQREGYMNVLDVYSISQQKRIGSYYLTLPGHDAFEVEPEGICQLEPGHFLMASAIIGTTRFRLYEATLPLVHSVTTSAENGKITDTNLEIDEGDSYTVSYGCDSDHRLQSLLVDDESVDITQYPTSYTFSDLQEDHSIQAIFEEIYNGDEQFPIKDVGCYRWEYGSEHMPGLAIDINHNENCEIRGGVITTGSYWKPGEDPYSIPADGDVVNAFKKYGFGWGGNWRSVKDYMHFSYFST